MEDQREQHTYEVLDLGPPLGRRRAEDDVAPALSDDTAPAEVMALGDIAGSVALSAPSPRWQRWTIMASVFLAGIAAGGYGWYAGTEAVQAANVEVIAVDLRGQEVPNNQQSDLFAQVHNPGPRDVTITDLRLPGEPDPTGNQIREVTVPAGGTRVVATRGTIDCESDLPDALEAEARTDAGTASVSVPLASGTTLELYFSPLCDRSDEQIRDVGVFLFSNSLDPVIGSPVHHMVLGMDHRLGNVEIKDVTVDAPGFAAEPTNLPVVITRGRPGSLELDWSVTDCGATHDLARVEVEVAYADRPPTVTTLPYSSVLELARFAVAECGS